MKAAVKHKKVISCAEDKEGEPFILAYFHLVTKYEPQKIGGIEELKPKYIWLNEETNTLGDRWFNTIPDARADIFRCYNNEDLIFIRFEE